MSTRTALSYGQLDPREPADYQHLDRTSCSGPYTFVHVTDMKFEQIIRHHRRALRSEHDLLHQPCRRPIRHCIMGLGPRLADLPLHCGVARRDMRRLSYRRRCILLECYALDEEVGTYNILDNRMVDTGWELDRYYEYQLWRSSVGPIGDYTLEG